MSIHYTSLINNSTPKRSSWKKRWFMYNLESTVPWTNNYKLAIIYLIFIGTPQNMSLSHPHHHIELAKCYCHTVSLCYSPIKAIGLYWIHRIKYLLNTYYPKYEGYISLTLLRWLWKNLQYTTDSIKIGGLGLIKNTEGPFLFLSTPWEWLRIIVMIIPMGSLDIPKSVNLLHTKNTGAKFTLVKLSLRFFFQHNPAAGERACKRPFRVL